MKYATVPLSALLAAGLLFAATAEARRHDPIFHPPPAAGDRQPPFSEAVAAGPFLFLSGMLGIDPETGQLVKGGIRAETRQTLELIKAAVERHGSSMDRVAKCTVFLAEMDEWATMNEVYVQYFPGGKPARSAVEVAALALDARLEIECIAVLEEPARPGGGRGD